ncbi:hypothetical protein AJ80_07950 [Polytolypa hystricis UAMH7299]|uniref:Uncharacterized protein n=1 Tax=Polytolypa hystricis (strain UAMH7299) TaxID=1447883 RepID=A0A2B7XFL4_POLH7|nr:hypothetical protein AJ80_07950 [Polytolypa hystricis UAMH7299]
MFYDLNVPYSPNDAEISSTLAFLAELGYTTIALSQTVSGKLPPNLTPPSLPSNAPNSLTLLTRLNLVLSDISQNARLSTLAQSYSLIALRPTNEKCLMAACNNLDCDIISLDFSTRLPFHFKFKTLSSAIARGVRLEICYGPGVTGSGLEARRNLMGNAAALVRATRGGRGIVISSEARRALGVRAPVDVVNLACVWGLSQEKGRDAVSEEPRKVVALAAVKRRSWRGIVDVVQGGYVKKKDTNVEEKKADDDDAEQVKAKGTNGTKRKASVSSPVGDVSTADSEKPLSKREMKRRAKKAKFEGAAGGDG